VTGRTGQLFPVVMVGIVVDSGGRVAAMPVLAPVVRSYLRLFLAMVLAGAVSGVAVKAFYSPSAIDIAVSLVSGAPAWVLSRRRVFRQLGDAGGPPAAETEPPSATTRRLFIRVARLTAFLSVILVAIPLLLGPLTISSATLRPSAPAHCSRTATPACCCICRHADGSRSTTA